MADNFSGIERMALNITREMLEINQEDEYLLIFKREIHPDFRCYRKKNHVKFKVLPEKNKLWFYQVTLFKVLRRLNADVFLFLAFPSPFFLRKKKMINTIHDMGCWDCPETMKRKMVAYFRLMHRNVAAKSWKILTISEFSRKRILEYLNVLEKNVQVVYLGVSENMYDASSESWNVIRERYGLPDRYMMCLSTLEPRKNMKLLVDAYDELTEDETRGCALVLAGRKGWKIDELLQTVSRKNRGRICITGHINERDLPELYRHAELFVFPSVYEGFGLPPLEAMAAGVPVLCSDIEVLKEILDSHAVYFRNRDKESLKQSLKQFWGRELPKPSPESLIQYSKNYSYKDAAIKIMTLWKN